MAENILKTKSSSPAPVLDIIIQSISTDKLSILIFMVNEVCMLILLNWIC